jgi:putative hydrolase of the HAD superfamily
VEDRRAALQKHGELSIHTVGTAEINRTQYESEKKMKYQAIFFDRDGTLVHGNPDKRKWMHETITVWSGKPLELHYKKMIGLMEKAGEGRRPWYRDVEDEKLFWKRYYRHLLLGEGVTSGLLTRAETLFSELWCENNPPIPYPETVGVLEYFRSHGYKMGVISDTSPSLKLSLQVAGLAEYFTSFTASSLVGADKPSPVIFNAALHAQGVAAADSLYVDDTDVEADGAREQGFTSFLINRTGTREGQWVIGSLEGIAGFVEAMR